MHIDAVDLILFFVSAYPACGLAFATAFVTIGIARIDPAAHGARLGLRLLLLPGATALWPILLVKWWRVVRNRTS